MPFSQVFYIVLPVFLILLISALFSKVKKIDLNAITETLLYVTLPAFIIAFLQKKTLQPEEIIAVSAGAVCVVLGVGIITFIYLHASGQGHLRGFYLPTMYMNSGNMGFPLAFLAFGEEALPYAIIYFVVVGLLVYTLGVSIAKGKGGVLEVFKLPLMYAAIIGLYLNYNQIALPKPLFVALDILGAATFPLLLFSLGYRLGTIKITTPFLALWGSVIRICGGVAIAYAVVSLFGITGMPRNVILLSSAMPSAVINFIVSQRYNANQELVASTIFLSTILSVLTTPIILTWIL